MGKRKIGIDISAFGLHLFAMSFMLCDHIWATLVPGNTWLTCIGRLAFPLFAFLLAEGFVHTGSRARYARRLLLFALLSEVPFDLIYAGGAFDPFQQNAIWTLLLGFLCMWALQSLKEKLRPWFWAAAAVMISALGWLLGTVLFMNYNGAGVLMVLLFYFFRGSAWWQRLGQLLGMLWINCVLIRGMSFPIELPGLRFELPLQSFAVLALGFIWLYSGRLGHRSKVQQYVFYAFYPCHMLLLALLGHLL